MLKMLAILKLGSLQENWQKLHRVEGKLLRPEIFFASERHDQEWHQISPMGILGHVSCQYLKASEMECGMLLVVKREAVPRPKIIVRFPAQAERKLEMNSDVEA
jgi:hypothetical protein